MSIEFPNPFDKPASSPVRPDHALRLAERTALVAMLVGAASCAVLTLRAGQRNPSLLLKSLFVLWVLSPFVCMAAAFTKAPRWPRFSRLALTSLMPLLSLASLALYANVVFGPPRSQPAAMFLLVPFISWVTIALVGLLAMLRSRDRSRRA